MGGRRISSPKVQENDQVHLSPAMEAGDFIFLSGIIPRYPEDNTIVTDDIEAGTRFGLEVMKNLLEEAGAGLNDLVKVNIYLSNINDKQAMNEIYKTYFPGDPPARTTVQVGSIGAGIMEIEGIAYRKNRQV